MKRLLLALFLGAWLLGGCAPTVKGTYYWGDYSKSLYDYKKAPGDESLVNHQKTLLNIIETSGKAKKRIPPGIYAELGYLYGRQGNIAEARRYFELELQTYPESEKLVQQLITSLENNAGGAE